MAPFSDMTRVPGSIGRPLVLGVLPTAAECVPGSMSRNVMNECGLAAVTEDVELIISKPVTNAGAPRGALSYPRHSREELEGGSWV